MDSSTLGLSQRLAALIQIPIAGGAGEPGPPPGAGR